jgi:hypothetical protein
MDCPARLSGTAWLFHVSTDKWSPIGANAVLDKAASFAWTGRSLVAVSPYLNPAGQVFGGYAAALNPDKDSWASLPDLPVPTAPPSGPLFSGTVWTGSELIDSGLVLAPGHSRTTGSGVASTLPNCPPITFPASVGGMFCGPSPGPGNGHGTGGSCLGNETAPPCGAGMVAGRYYAYTLIPTCGYDYVDGRWWRNELPGGAEPVHVWVSVNAARIGAGWIGPNGAVGFQPSSATSCS